MASGVFFGSMAASLDSVPLRVVDMIAEKVVDAQDMMFIVTSVNTEEQGWEVLFALKRNMSEPVDHVHLVCLSSESDGTRQIVVDMLFRDWDALVEAIKLKVWYRDSHDQFEYFYGQGISEIPVWRNPGSKETPKEFKKFVERCISDLEWAHMTECDDFLVEILLPKARKLLRA